MIDASLRVGLRFDRRDRFKLQELAHRVEQAEIQGDLSTFTEAARAAESGEPLVVICSSPDEAQEMAAMYGTLGCRRPAVEDLAA